MSARTLTWPSGYPPPDIPKCGFENEDPACNQGACPLPTGRPVGPSPAVQPKPLLAATRTLSLSPLLRPGGAGFGGRPVLAQHPDRLHLRIQVSGGTSVVRLRDPGTTTGAVAGTPREGRWGEGLRDTGEKSLTHLRTQEERRRRWEQGWGGLEVLGTSGDEQLGAGRVGAGRVGAWTLAVGGPGLPSYFCNGSLRPFGIGPLLAEQGWGVPLPQRHKGAQSCLPAELNESTGKVTERGDKEGGETQRNEVTSPRSR